MKWEGQDQSSNVEDRRSAGGGGGGGFGGLPIGGKGIGIGTVAVALVAGWMFGINPLTMLGILSGGEGGTVAQQPQVQAGKPAPGDPASALPWRPGERAWSSQASCRCAKGGSARSTFP